MANQFGDRVRQLRKTNRLLQRQVAVKVGIDIPMLSKIERGERKAKRAQVLNFSNILNVSRDELVTLWLADQVVEVLQNEDLALKAIQVAEEEVKYNSRNRI